VFESICVREESIFRSGDIPIDIGALAEAMLFYQHVHVVGRADAFEHIARRFTTDVLLEYLNEGHLSLAYYPDFPSVLTDNTGTPLERHLPTVLNFSGLELERVLPEVGERLTGARGRGRRWARRFAPHVHNFKHRSEVESHSRDDFRDPSYLASAFREVLGLLVPEYTLPPDLQVRVREAGDDRIQLETNIDFSKVNEVFHVRVSPKHASLTPAYLLSHIVAVRADLDMAAALNSEMTVTPISGALARTKVGSVLDRADISARHVARFQELSFDESRALREVINRGERTMEEFLEVLRGAQKFRRWLRQQPEEASLIKEYFRAVTKDSWIDKLPVKATRFALVTAVTTTVGAAVAGPIGVAAGNGLSAADTFLLDRLTRGWRPNQFIEGPLREFVRDPIT